MASIVIKRASSFIGSDVIYNVLLVNKQVGKLGNGGTLKIPVNVGIHRLSFAKIKHLPIHSEQDVFFDVVVNDDNETVELKCEFEQNAITVEYADNKPHIPTFNKNTQQKSSVNDECSNDFYKYDDCIEDVERNGDFTKKDYSKFGTKIKKCCNIITTTLFILYTLGFLYLWVLLKDVFAYSYYSMELIFALVIGYAFCMLCTLALFYFTYGFGIFLENYEAEQERILSDFDKMLKTRLNEAKTEQKTRGGETKK